MIRFLATALFAVGAGQAALAQTAGTAPNPAKWQQVIDAAKAEGAVTIYSAQGLDQLNDLAARFKKEYGITAQVVRAVESELWPKIDAERDSGRGIADVFVATDLVSIKDRAAKGFIAAPLGPDFDAPVYDKVSRLPEGSYFEVSAAVLTFSWNKDLHPKGIKDYPDVLDPSLAGKIGISAVSVPAQIDFFVYLEENYGADFTTKLAALKPRIYPGALPMAQAVVSGEIAVGLSTQPLIDDIKKGAPVGWGLAPKAWGARFWGQIVKSAPHPNAAQLLANFIVTRPGQEAVSRLAASVLPNIDGSIANTSSVRRQDMSKLTPDFVAQYREKWRKLFTPN